MTSHNTFFLLIQLSEEGLSDYSICLIYSVLKYIPTLSLSLRVARVPEMPPDSIYFDVVLNSSLPIYIH